ncbi:MAG: YdjY domain-containing protein [Mariniblastus sp.]|nr:YdjY domain-containing protein [Mariniblastus sp.]
MPKRQINRLIPWVATCLFCLFCMGCGSDSPSGKATAPSSEATGEQETQRPGNAPAVTSPSHAPAVSPGEATGDLAQTGEPPGDKPPTEPQASTPDENSPPDATPGETEAETEQQTIPITDNWVRLSKQHEIWIDMKAKQVMVAGQICLDRGGLEVFACPRQTKEHESVVSVNALALELHTCLIAIGADPGKPVQWTPEYQPANGPKIKIQVRWSEENQQVTRNAKELVRNFDTKKELDMDWVFCGSQFYVNPEDGSKVYYGDSGEMICLSNFSTATLDLPIESSGSNESLLFEANTEKIPPLGTKVYLVLSLLKQDAQE